MSEHGAALQTYNQELVKCLEDLKVKRTELLEIIRREEAEKMVLEKNMRALQDKMNTLSNNLQHHRSICETYDKTISETEIGFKKILESSQALLQVAQYEANKLGTGNDCNILESSQALLQVAQHEANILGTGNDCSVIFVPFAKDHGY